MFQQIDNTIHPLPGLAAACVVILTLSVVIVAPLAYLQTLDLVSRAASVPLFVPSMPPHHKKSSGTAETAKIKKTTAASDLSESVRDSANVIVARPGTPSWEAHVARGKRLSLNIYAQRSLPVLRAHRVLLAIDEMRPRLVTNLFDLETQTPSRGSVPGGIVVRELDEMPTLPGLEPVLRSVSRVCGCTPKIYALYPESLYSALESLTEQALLMAGEAAEGVHDVKVELHLVSGQSFSVQLMSHS